MKILFILLIFIFPNIASAKNLNFTKIVDLKASAKKAREIIWSVRKGSDFKKIAKDVYLKHGSRLRRA